MFEKISANLVNVSWAVVKISCVYVPKNLLGIKKEKKEKEKAGKIIECTAIIGLRYLSVRRPKKARVSLFFRRI